MTWPMYYVLTPDGELAAYWDLEILLCDLSRNRDVPVRLFKLAVYSIQVKYLPVTEAELRREAA